MSCRRFNPLPCVVLMAGTFFWGLGSLSSRAAELYHARNIAERAAQPALAADPGLILREEWWKGSLEPGKARLFPHQLFSKNIYQFWLAVPDPSVTVQLNLYDGKGKLVATQAVDCGGAKNVASIVAAPAKSGTYYLRLALDKNAETSQDWALIYAYK